ncbi:MAG: DUF1446 domain-containing protein [Hyphomicrobiales bacterium]|nr:DUF1446 domain-containing protein [Hyphomicrobiales bacterium]
MTAEPDLKQKSSSIRIGGACGYWGDASIATRQLLSEGNLDFIVYDYLAEITMSIMARAISKDWQSGYASDFISLAIQPNLEEIARQGVKIISNAGGINPLSCSRAVDKLIGETGYGLKVACVTGDNLLDRSNELSQLGIRGMFEDDDFPDPKAIGSINVYTGAFAIARALKKGADIVIVGRCVDSAVTLGACIYSFGWTREMLDQLALGSLAGHIIECGTQATGGNFTDWRLVADNMDNLGYPIVEVDRAGGFVVTKPERSEGLVSIGTVGEQIVYEIDDPQNYLLPDVCCDFSNVKLNQIADNKIAVSGAKGFPAPTDLKTVITWHDGFRGGQYLTFYGFDAADKADKFARAAIGRAERILDEHNLPPYTSTSIEILGNESQYGKQAIVENVREVCIKIAARHQTSTGIAILSREITGLALSGPPGLSGFAGTRPRPSPVMKLFSCLLPRDVAPLTIHFDTQQEIVAQTIENSKSGYKREKPEFPQDWVTEKSEFSGDTTRVELIKLAWARSGDKGNKANIGIIARDKKYLPFIWQQLDEQAMALWFDHFLEGEVKRYYMPGLGAINYVLDRVLDGGGTASLRNDPQAKGYAQLALAIEIEIPVEMAAGLL